MQVLFREFWRATLLGIGIYVVLNWKVFLSFLNMLLSGETSALNLSQFTDLGMHLVYCWVLYAVNAYAFRLSFAWFGSRIFSRLYLPLAILGNGAISLISVLLVKILSRWIANESLLGLFRDDELTFVIRVFLIAMLISGLVYGYLYNRHREKNRIQEHQFIARDASARFDALKNQLDPHFLFNSLNVLSGLIDEDPRQAQRFTTALSKVYRYVLEQKHKELVSLEEEFDFARTYINLLNMRFEDSLTFSIPENVIQSEGRIVPLSLQLLLENAVKHNVATSAKPLRIEIREGNGVLEVINNLEPRQTRQKSVGVGLQNIQERYRLLSDRKIELHKTESEFRVLLPVLTKRASTVKKQESLIADKRYEKAKAKLEAVKGFYANLTAYILVIPLLIWINYRTTSFPWAIFPALGWGFGLLMHGMEAYGVNPLWGKRWEERKIRELMEREDF
ncbi:MAG: hypothetical protein RLZZ241_1191 [Bacteroidota bacterium]